MDVEISEQTFETLKKGGLVVIGLVVLVVVLNFLSSFFGSPLGLIPEVLLNKTDPVQQDPTAAQVQSLISQMCVDRILATKYEQDPASSHPQLVKLRPLVQQYEQVTGKTFRASVCLRFK